MLSDDSLLKALRTWRGQTQIDLEFKTTLSQSYISDLESGKSRERDASQDRGRP